MEVSASDSELRYVADVDAEYRSVGLSERFILEAMELPGDDEVQVDIHAASVNFGDVMVRLQLVHDHPSISFIHNIIT